MERKSTTARRPRQLGILFRSWGGKRPGAGRKPTRPGAVSHGRRPALASRFPVHVTLKLDPSLPSLREGPLLPVIEDSFRQGKQRHGFRLPHYSIQEHHLHLIVEAADAQLLAKGIQALCIRIARGINRALGRGGRVFSDRYFARILKTPRQTRAALVYVINNVRRHASQRGERLPCNWIDDRCSGRFFDGWRAPPPRSPEAEPTVTPARTWLLSKGWRKHGLLRVDEVPGPEP